MKMMSALALVIVTCATLQPVANAQQVASCIRGKSDAPVRIEVFSDFECPACYAFYMQTMRRVFADYADAGKVCVVYREFPLEVHPHARDAARYALAARRLGVRQWAQVADVLFEVQPEWSRTGDIDSALARTVAAKDMDFLRKQVDDPVLDERIDSDILRGLDLEINSTPTFFITARGRTEKVAAALTYAAMQRRLDALLAQPVAMLEGGSQQ